MTTTFDHLSRAYALLSALDACEDEALPVVLIEALDAFEAETPERADKLAALRAVAKAAEARQAACRAEVKRIQARSKTAGNTITRVRSMALALLEAEEAVTGEARIQTETVTYRLQASPPSIAGPDKPADWPAAFHVTKLTVDKRAALKAVKSDPDSYPDLSLHRSRSVRW